MNSYNIRCIELNSELELKIFIIIIDACIKYCRSREFEYKPHSEVVIIEIYILNTFKFSFIIKNVSVVKSKVYKEI